LTTDYKKFL